ncbi:MAG: ABC transporter permease [Bacillota bacterium]
MRKQCRDFAWLLLGELYSLRLAWFWYLVHMALSPLLNMFLLYMYGGRGNPQATLFAVTGSLAQGLTVASMLTLGQNIGSLKDQNAYEHYATLPISRLTFLLATTTRSMIFSVPSFIVILVTGVTVLRLPLSPNALLVPVVLVAGYSLAALGAFIGFYSPTGQVASLATQVLAGLMSTMAPVYLTLEQLPQFLRVTALAVPTTYVARALRAALTGPVTPALWTDIGILLAFTSASLWLVTKKVDWRGQR